MLEDTWFLKYAQIYSARPIHPKSSPTSLSSPTSPPHQTQTQNHTQKSSKFKTKQQDPLQAKWTRRKRLSYLPPLRSGCTMTLWAAKGTGVLFGGVTDEDTSEERMESVFWNDLCVEKFYSFFAKM